MADYASLGSRIVAVVVDHIILWIIVLALMIPMGIQMVTAEMLGYGAVFNPMAQLGAMAGYMALSFVIWIIYFTYLEGSSGQTVGKRAMNIKSVREDGKQLTYTDAFIRNILRIVDSLPFAYLLGLILVAVTEKNQRIGDMIARTVVVKA